MAATGNRYPFGNDFYALARLNYQHSLSRQCIGYLLHPEIPIGDGLEIRIADVGSGTCKWLTDLSELLPPSASLDAFDISAAQYPPQEWLPDNISLRIHDAFQPFPKDCIGKYDIVHVQCFISLIADNDPGSLIDNLASLLKPGGFLQWTEIDAASGRKVEPADEAVSSAATDRFIKFMQRPQANHSVHWVSQLDRTLTDQGFSNAKLTRYGIPPRDYFSWNLNRLWAADEMIKKGYRGDPAEANIEKLVESTFEEFQQGVAVVADLVVVIGKAPS